MNSRAFRYLSRRACAPTWLLAAAFAWLAGCDRSVAVGPSNNNGQLLGQEDAQPDTPALTDAEQDLAVVDVPPRDVSAPEVAVVDDVVSDVPQDPNARAMCEPCKASSDCSALGAGAACAAVGKPAGSEGHFCAVSCENGAACPDGYYCDGSSTIEGGKGMHCVPQGDLCPCTASTMAHGWTAACFAAAYDAFGVAIGSCPGTWSCSADGKGTCSAKTPTVEACDGIDNNCDGVTDEAGATPLCDDGNPCTVDACVGGKCQSGPDTCNCKADKDCNGAGVDLCAGKHFCDMTAVPFTCKVAPGSAVVCDVSQDNTCAATVCDAKTGKCGKVAKADGKPCDADGSVCTMGDACKAGACQPGSALACDDNNVCTLDGCDPGKGCVHTPTSMPCDADGNACTVGDACAAGKCVAGALKTCDDGNPCTLDGCDTKSGVCVATPAEASCDDGNPCTTGDVCAAGSCKPGAFTCECQSDADCAGKNGGNLCLGQFACVTSGGSPHCQLVPNSAILCTTAGDTTCAKNACHPATGECSPIPISEGEPCNDGNACTGNDVCKTGECIGGAPVVCDDGNPCTDDSCVAQSGCEHAPNTAPCDADGSACTGGDSCAGGSCHAGAPLNCGDNNPCTTDGCDAKIGCTHTPLAGPCDDGDACTFPDACANGICAPGPQKDCGDGNPCTANLCSAGQCSYDAAAMDGQPCTNTAVCKATGACKAGACTYPSGVCGGGIHDTWPIVVPGKFGPATAFFDPVGYHTVDITLTAADWASYLADVANATVNTNASFYHADVTIDGTTYGNVGIRKFGYGSMLTNPGKPNIRVKFDNYVNTAKGPESLKDMRLKGSGQDATFIREPLTYAIARAVGGVAPRTSWARVKVNGVAYGLYQVIEQIDGDMFKAWFGNKNGPDYKATTGCIGLNCPGGNCYGVKGAYTAGAGTMSELVALADAIANAPSTTWVDKVSGLVDLDSFLVFYAMDALLSNVDGINSSGNNYEIYGSTANSRLYFILGGCDLTFGNWGAWYDLWAPWGPPTTWCPGYTDPFYKRAVTTPYLKGKLDTLLKALHCGAFGSATVLPVIDGYKQLLKTDLYYDPKGIATQAQINNDYSGLKAYINNRNGLLANLYGGCP